MKRRYERYFFFLLFDDFDYSPRARIDQNWSLVDDRVTIFTDTVFRRNLIISDARFGKDRAYAHIAFIPIGWTVLFDDVTPETGALIDAENAVYATDDP